MKTMGKADVYLLQNQQWVKLEYKNVIAKLSNSRVEIIELVDSEPKHRYNFPDHICAIVWLNND